MIRGIDRIYASKLLAVFGDQVLEVIEQARERLREVPGIGPVRGQQSAKLGRIRRWFTKYDQQISSGVMMTQLVFVHGVSVRNEPGDQDYEKDVARRRKSFQEMGLGGGAVEFYDPYWGKFGAPVAYKSIDFDGDVAS